MFVNKQWSWKMHEKNGLVPDDIFMSKRLQVAAIMAQGLLSNDPHGYSADILSEDALEFADALIDKESNEGASWQENLIDEEKALHEKILTLDEFLSNYDKTDPDGEELYDLYVDQLSSMVAYDATLNTRIALL